MKGPEMHDFVEQNRGHIRSSLDAENQNGDPKVHFLTCGHPAILGFVATWESGQLFQKSAM